MKPVLFTDLDDTLFRSLSRLGGDTAGLEQVTIATNGNHSWMTARQRRFVDWAFSAMEVIPVTARSADAFARVALPFSGPAILSNGALILDANGRTDPVWRDRVDAIATASGDRLRAMLRAVEAAVLAGDLRAWIVQEHGRDIYLCIKSNGPPATVSADLDRAQSLLAERCDLAGLTPHRNGNNLSFTPEGISKAAAVTHLLETMPGLADRVLLGAGDSLTDLPFMALADFLVIPPTAQIVTAVDEGRGIAPLPAGSAGSGSYAPGDVRFLLRTIDIAPTDIEEKERLIQSGARHYSEMISAERAPDPEYLRIFDAACAAGIPRIAREMSGLARAIALRAPPGPVVLCSLVRAGLPYGVILARELRATGLDAPHFGVSIIRDRGLDTAAMAALLDRFPARNFVFVDGWTGKGAISAELHRSWRALTGEAPFLAVLADPCGRADLSGSHEDWLIPSGILGGVISGLVSRSVRSRDPGGPAVFDGCARLDHLRDADLSRDHVDRIGALMPGLRGTPPAIPDAAQRLDLQDRAEGVVKRIMAEFGVGSRNLVKPGIAEATRALLRRRPARVLLRSAGDADLAPLHYLCAQKGVDVIVNADLTGPYRAVTLIREVAA